MYMLPIAGQTAGPNGLKFFVDTHWWSGCVNYFFSNFFFHGQHWALQLVVNFAEKPLMNILDQTKILRVPL